MASSFHSLGWHPETWTFQCLRTSLRNQGLHLQPGKKMYFFLSFNLASVTDPYLSFVSDWSSFLLPLPQGRRGPHRLRTLGWCLFSLLLFWYSNLFFWPSQTPQQVPPYRQKLLHLQQFQQLHPKHQSLHLPELLHSQLGLWHCAP